MLEAITFLVSGGVGAWATLTSIKAKSQQATWDHMVRTFELNSAKSDAAREFSAVKEGLIKKSKKSAIKLFGHSFWEVDRKVHDQGHVIGNGFHVTRRIIALLIVTAAFVAPVLLPVLYPDITIAYGYVETVQSIFTADVSVIKWLILGDGQRVLFIPPYISLSVSSVTGLFFGNQIVK